MSEIKKCPDCGAEITSDCDFCPDCGADLRGRGEAAVASKPSSDEAVPTGRGSEGLTFGEGSRTNIGGNVNSSTSNIDHSVNHVNTNVQSTHTVNESHVDQSSTVNSTTIIQNEKPKEYCGVCGRVLDENHARCPQCGKNVCVSCLVKGKNRCTKCEKQAVNDFRMAVKQVILTSGGQLTFTEKEMLQQRAVQLDVEDVKDQILKEALESCRPVPKATQPIGGSVAGAQRNVSSSSNPQPQSKGVGVLDQRQPINSTSSKSSGGGSSSLLWIIVVVVLGLGGWFLFSDDEEDYEEQQPVEQVKQVTKETVAPTAPKAEPETPVASKPKPAPRKNESAVPKKKVAEKVDQNYIQGMQAYHSGDGLEAVSLFKKSGSAQAYYMLGVIYESGCGNVGENPMMARKFFKKSAAMGNADAKAKL